MKEIAALSIENNVYKKRQKAIFEWHKQNI